jgi:hypothetical protein
MSVSKLPWILSGGGHCLGLTINQIIGFESMVPDDSNGGYAQIFPVFQSAVFCRDG